MRPRYRRHGGHQHEQGTDRRYKGDLFLLDLTFIGWNLLCSLTLGILSIWIAPYIIQTNIGYFQEIKRIKGIGWQARP